MKCPRCSKGSLICVRTETVDGRGRAQQRICRSCSHTEIWISVPIEEGVKNGAARVAAAAVRLRASKPRVSW